MAIFHCSIKIIGRSGGRSAVAAAAYRSGEKLYNEETGITHDFTRKGGVVMSEILLPDNAPKQYLDRQTLWNEVQKIEKRSDAQLAREIEVALPMELAIEQQIECVRAYIQENFTAKGMIADWALHDKGDGNPHAHILLSVRGIDENEKWQTKQKSVFANARDEKGRPVFDPAKPSYNPKDKENTAQYRIPVLDKNGNQKTRVREGKGAEYLWERISIPANDWNEHSKAEEWRKSWAEHCNRYLSPEAHIDHRSYKRQELDMEPTIHEGVTARQIERRGKVSDRCQINREVKDRNAIRLKLKRTAEEITTYIKEMNDNLIEKARELYGRFKNLTGLSRTLGQTKSDDGLIGGTAGRDRKPDRTGTRDAAGAFGEQGSAGRIHVLEREFDKRKSETHEIIENLGGTETEIADTDREIESLTRIKNEKERERNERLRKLQQRRSVTHPAGADAGRGGGERQAVGGERRNAGTERCTDNGLAETADDIRQFLDCIAAQEQSARAGTRDSESERNNQIAERMDREAERRRLDIERKREAESRQRKVHTRGGIEI